jgi:drug/metabolite transporter (DMT)-like permease
MTSAILIFSALLHASWNTWVKRSENKEVFLGVLIAICALISWVMLAFFPAPMPTARGWMWALASGVFDGLYLVSLSRTFTLASLSWSYALMRGAAMVFVWILSAYFFKETIHLPGAFGAVLIFIALWIPLLSKGQGRLSPAGFKASLLSALFIAGYHIHYDLALHAGVQPYALFAISITISAPFSLLDLVLKKKLGQFVQLFKKQGPYLFVCALLMYWSFALFLMGLEKSAPGIAITLRNTSIFFALVMARFLGEKVTIFQFLTCLLVFVGAFLLSL